MKDNESLPLWIPVEWTWRTWQTVRKHRHEVFKVILEGKLLEVVILLV